MSKANCIGIDIGGTKIAAALYDEGGRVLVEDAMRTPASYDELVTVCAGVIARYRAYGPADIGVGLPGQIHTQTRLVTAPNIPYLADSPFLIDLESRLEQVVVAGNDADCAALAEAREGAGQGADTCFMVTLGTGVGGAYIVNGHTLRGVNGLSCEVGHLPLPCYDPRTDGVMPVCMCGRTGCAEAFVNAAGFARLAARYGFSGLDPVQVSDLIGHDPKAEALLDSYSDLLAKTLANVIFAYDPAVIILGGGLAHLPNLCDAVPKKWARYVLGRPLLTHLRRAALGAAAGMRGAALLASHKANK